MNYAYQYDRNVAANVSKALKNRGLSTKIVFGRKPVVEGVEEDFTLCFLLGCTPEQIALLNKEVAHAEGEVLISFRKQNENGKVLRFEAKDFERAPHKLGSWECKLHIDGDFDEMRGFNEDILKIIFVDFPES